MPSDFVLPGEPMPHRQLLTESLTFLLGQRSRGVGAQEALKRAERRFGVPREVLRNVLRNL